MSQQALAEFPATTATDWLPNGAADLAAAIHKAVGNPSNDAVYDYVIDPISSTFRVKLTTLSACAIGTQTITVRLKTAGTGSYSANITLFQDTTQKAAWTVPTLSSEFTDYFHSLSDLEKNSITDYTKLWLEITANANVSINCCANTLPGSLKATLMNTDPANHCLCVNGTILSLLYNPATQKWHGSGSVGTCGTTLGLDFYCVGADPNGFALAASGCTTESVTLFSTGLSCNPLHAEFRFSPLDSVSCCGSEGAVSFKAVVTI